MAMVDALLPEFDHEIAMTRKVLERVDETRLGWQPHEKSMTLGRLARHVAEIPQWGKTILDEPEFNLVDGAAHSRMRPRRPPNCWGISTAWRRRCARASPRRRTRR